MTLRSNSTRSWPLFSILAAAVATVLGAAAVLSSCSKKPETASPSAPAAPGGLTVTQEESPTPAAGATTSTSSAAPAGGAPSAARGRTVYLSACIACHNSDPKKAGSLGPEVFGASLELLTKRILDGTYPEGYKPKRSTHVMQPLPQVRNDIPSIHAYLNAP